MISYVVRRVLQIVPTILVTITIIFFLLTILPGDAALLSGDPRTLQDPDVVKELRERWGLDEPIYKRYVKYVGNLLTGDLGVSRRTFQSVTSILAQKILPTLELVLFSYLIATTLGISLGFLSAIYQGSILDFSSMMFAVSGISAPRFWVGLLLAYLFGYKLNIFPVSGFGGGSITHLILPAFTLSIPLVALLARTTRSSVLEVIGKDYVRTARSKGLSETIVNLRHVFRNAMIPIITVSGLQLGRLVARTVIVEKIFRWPGLGKFAIRSIIRRDIPAIQGVILIFCFSVIIANLTVDILYGFIDPTVRYD